MVQSGFSVCDAFRCLIENVHTEHNNFKTTLPILLLQNYKKPLEQEEEKQKQTWYFCLHK